MANLSGNWNYPTSVRFGPGRIAELPEVCLEIGIRRPVLVTDRGLIDSAMVQHAIVALRGAGIDVAAFGDIDSDPTGDDVVRGGAALRAHRGDGVIAFGGGSSLDAGKAVAFATFQEGPLWAYEDVGDNFKRADISKILPVIAVPTTAGTGSEVGRASVIKDDKNQIKRIIFHPMMLPKIVIADPELTICLPTKLTAAVGMDALSHNLEAFFAPGYHPFARGIAVEGARLIKEWLPVAVREPTNLVARSNMLAASQAGATAFQRGLGAMHALAHPLGAVYGVHHGLLNAVLMPYVIVANRPIIDEDAAYLARCLEIGGTAGDLLKWIIDLREEVGVPHSLEQLGIPNNEIARIARMAVEDGSAGTNPITFTAVDYEVILTNAITGNSPSTAATTSNG